MIEEHVSGEYAFTLDGNEQYTEIAAFRELWKALHGDPTLSEVLEQLIFVEQPLNRTVALSNATPEAMARLDRPSADHHRRVGRQPDQSAQGVGLRLCGHEPQELQGRLQGRDQRLPAGQAHPARCPTMPAMLSGEDLSNVGPVALLQDLAVAASLGITHLERNGHHYFRGLSMYDDELQTASAGPSSGSLSSPCRRLRRRLIDGRGHAGRLVVDAPFGLGFELDPSCFVPLADWKFASLDGQGTER